MRTRITEYKDANRVWWKIVLKETDTFVLDKTSGETITGDEHTVWEYRHTIWEYEVFNEQSEKYIYCGTITGQYDHVPCIQDVIRHISNDFNSVCLGMSRYCEHWQEEK